MDDDEAMRRLCAILESVAKNYPADSEEAHAIRDAAAAYTVVRQQRTLKKRYQELVYLFDGQLTPQLEALLRAQGIDPDEFTDDDELDGGESC